MTIELKTTSGIKITNALKGWLDANGYKPKSFGHTAYTLAAATAMADGVLGGDNYMKLTEDEETGMSKSPDPEQVFGGTKSAGGSIRVKKPSERLNTKRWSATHEKTGKPVRFVDASGCERECERASEKDRALAGVYLKYSAQRAGLCRLSDFEKELFSELCQDHDWASYAGPDNEAKIYPAGTIKASLLDDSTSGGLEAAPIAFDDQVVEEALLKGELFPFVRTINIARGRRVEAAAVGTPSVVWGTSEGTGGTAFDFTGYVSAVNTSIFPVAAFLTIGRDALEDFAVDMANVLMGRLSERLASEYDDMVASGNGTTQPEGVINKSGATSVAFGGTTSIGNYESLLFGVAKQYRAGKSNFLFCGTETSYQRARALPVGASDERRLFGMDHESYQLFAPRRYAINESLTNQQLFSGDMSRYRWYRRLGMRIEWSKEGDTLMRANSTLCVLRSRVGGQCELGAPFAVVADAPA